MKSVLAPVEPAVKTAGQPINLLGLSRPRLEAFFLGLGEPAFRARQLLKWLHQRGEADFERMTDLSRSLRSRLAQACEVRAPEIALEQTSADGTRKRLLRLDDGNCIETVFIPEEGRGTLCVSSQVGCALDCTFCSTARQGFNRNLTAAEIVGQLWLARSRLQATQARARVITNVVFMGMGEPLLNYDAVLDAMSLMLDDLAYGLGKRRVTLSTSGVVPAMDRLKDALDVSLAVSLHAPDNALRDQLVPLNRKYPLEVLLPACKRFVSDKSRKLSVTFEYVMLKDVNDHPDQARQLVRLLRGIPSKINLIPVNPFPRTRYQRSEPEAIDRFRKILIAGGLHTITRKTRGDDIDAACGQLAGKVADRSRRALRFARLEEGLT